MKLSPAQLALLPAEEDICFYEEHGYYVSKRIFTDEELDDAIYGSERYYAGERDYVFPLRGGYLDWKPEDGYGLRQNDYVSLQNEEIRRLVESPLIGAIAACLSRETKGIRLFHDQLIWKPPGGRGGDSIVGWHTDRAYWLTCTSERMLTAWIPFRGVQARSGTISVIDGSHKWSGAEAFKTFRDRDLSALEARCQTGGAKIVEVPIELERGQVSFHHCRTIHGSHPNIDDRPRLALAVHMQGSDNRYVKHRDRTGNPILHINDTLCRMLDNGEPDYADANICPVLWSGGDPLTTQEKGDDGE